MGDPTLAELLDGLPPAIETLAREVVTLVGTLQPDLEARVRLGWRSVNFRHPAAGFVCAVFPYPDRVSLIFEQGRLLEDPEGLLEGTGRQVRYVPMLPGRPLPEAGIALLLGEAIALRS